MHFFDSLHHLFNQIVIHKNLLIFKELTNVCLTNNQMKLLVGHHHHNVGGREWSPRRCRGGHQRHRRIGRKREY